MRKTRIKKVFAMFLATIMLASGAVAAAASPVDAGLLPLRAIFEAGGATVEWNEDDRTIHVEAPQVSIVFHTNQPVAYVNGTAVDLQNGVVLWEGQAFISEADLMLALSPPIDLAGLDDSDIARLFMQGFVAGDILGILQLLSDEMQAYAEAFAEMYAYTVIGRGNFVDWALEDEQIHEGGINFYFATTNTTGRGAYLVFVNDNGLVDGFFDQGFVFEPIFPADDANYTAEAVVVGEGTPWALDGLLTMPRGASAENPVPAVVLVHGSGAGNMDQSIFDNRPFHDIATYLSSNGIAVIRYNKRVLTHGAAYVKAFGENATVWEETIEDALLAAKILQADPRISRVYVAGLSLGGILAPRIAEEGGLDGAILLAAPARALFEVQYEQNLLSINSALEMGLISQAEADEIFAMIAGLLEEARNLPNMTEQELQNALIFGIPAVWQRSYLDSLPIPIISRNVIPTLILHGDRDWQVSTERDFKRFVEYVGDYDHVTTILYNNVNHILMQSQTDFDDLRDYAPLGNVYKGLLQDIVRWINGNRD